jgi:glycosyltransferase involved in cell wall biosynthesis
VTDPLRVLVMTVVHRPQDARILHRQIRAMTQAGWSVTYAAPWSATGQAPPPGLATRDLPRACGRRRVRAVRAARRLIRGERDDHDIVLVHDPELLLAVAGVGRLPPVVWDVHEDPGASLSDRSWVPASLRPVLRGAIRVVERWAESRHHLTLAETSYRDRFRDSHPVIPNTPVVPARAAEPGVDRVVHLGRHSRSRGAEELVTLADRLAPHGIRVELLGYADDDVRELLERARDAGRIEWSGFVPNDVALERTSGALAGLCLLRDEPNFRGSMPTKVLEYLAHGLPIITTPLPLPARLVEDEQVGTVVPFEDPDAVAAAVLALARSGDERGRIHARARAVASESFDWTQHAQDFLAFLSQLAR